MFEELYFSSLDAKLHFYVKFDNERQMIDYVVNRKPFTIRDNDTGKELGLFQVVEAARQKPNRILITRAGTHWTGDTQGDSTVFFERIGDAV